MLRAYKTKLRPTRQQSSFFFGCAGFSRFVFNWALADRIARYEAGEKTSMYEQKKRFNAIKFADFAWCKEYPMVIGQEAFVDCDTAYKNFFRRVKSGAEKAGFPKFKSRHKSASTFRVIQGVKVERDRIKLPKVGWVNLAERGYLPTDRKVKQATVSERAGDWFVSVLVEADELEPIALSGVLGVDVGVSKMAIVSDGAEFAPSDKYTQLEKRLKNLQRKLARQNKGSANRKKTQAKIKKVWAQIANHRSHVQHNASAYITRHAAPEAVVLETLNVSGMTRKPKPKPNEDGAGYQKNNARAKAGLNRGILNSGIGELHRQIQYKAEWNGIEVVSADRWFASSKTCSGCGNVANGLKLSDRTYKCPRCGLVIDRDLNAAKNLAALVD